MSGRPNANDTDHTIRSAPRGPSAPPPDDEPFAIDVSCWSERWTVRVSGEVDPTGASAIVDVTEVLANRRPFAVDLDLSAVTSIDGAGWRAVAYAEDLLTISGAKCRLITPPSPVAHPSRPMQRPERSTGHAA